jgi:DNA-binding NarL/FixJ family response regulator
MPYRAVIADDHAMFRDGLQALLLDVMDFDVVEQAGSLDEALAILNAGAATDLLIVDLRMPGVTGAESFTDLRARFPTMKLVVMSASEERADILDSLTGRINGYIPKSVSSSEIEKALTDILDGRIYVPAILSESALSDVQEKSTAPRRPVSGLTSRQQQVLQELLKGKSSKQIARELNIVENTVKIHLASIYRAIGVKTRAEAIAKLGGGRIGHSES